MGSRKTRFAGLILLLLSVPALVVSGCSPATAAPAPTETPARQYSVGLLLSSLYNPLYVSLQNGAIEAASRLDVEILVREAGNSAEQQDQQIQELLQLGVDALVVNPVDSAALSGAVKRARNAGVPVITVERRINSRGVVSHVSSDNVSGGEMAAVYLSERLGQEGDVVELVGIPGTSAAQDRGSGFNRIMDGYPEVTIVAREVANFERRQAERIFAQMLQEHTGIDGVFAHNDEMILGAIDAAEDAGAAQDMIFVGFDAVGDAVTAVEEGRLAATIAQQPTEMGRLALEVAVQHLRGETVAENVLVELALIAR